MTSRVQWLGTPASEARVRWISQPSSTAFLAGKGTAANAKVRTYLGASETDQIPEACKKDPISTDCAVATGDKAADAAIASGNPWAVGAGVVWKMGRFIESHWDDITSFLGFDSDPPGLPGDLKSSVYNTLIGSLQETFQAHYNYAPGLDVLAASQPSIHDSIVQNFGPGSPASKVMNSGDNDWARSLDANADAICKAAKARAKQVRLEESTLSAEMKFASEQRDIHYDNPEALLHIAKSFFMDKDGKVLPGKAPVVGFLQGSAIKAEIVRKGKKQKEAIESAKKAISDMSVVRVGKCGINGRGLTEAERIVFDFNKKPCSLDEAGRKASSEWSKAFTNWLSIKWPNDSWKSIPEKDRDSDAYAKAVITGQAPPPDGWQKPAPSPVEARVASLSTAKSGPCGFNQQGITQAERLIWQASGKPCDTTAASKTATDQWIAAYNAWVAKKTGATTITPGYFAKFIAVSGPAQDLSPDAFAKEILTGQTPPPTGWQAPSQDQILQAPSATTTSTGGSTGGGSGSDNTPVILLGLGAVAVLGYFLMQGKSSNKA